MTNIDSGQNSPTLLKSARQWAVLVASLAPLTGVAFAADQPVYAPPAEWVVQRDLPAADAARGGEPVEVLLWDQQVNLDAAGSHAYMRLAVRVGAPQGLMELNTLSAEWYPQFQTLTLHHVTIRRGDEIIDSLGRGQRFSVLRRETNLEIAMLDGALTAVLQPEGLRVGDVLDFAYTVSGSDPVLEGKAQTGFGLPQLNIEEVHLRASWNESMDVRWQTSNDWMTLVSETRNGSETAVELNLDRPEPFTPPLGAPARYLIGPYIEFSSYASWREVSSQMAPLYRQAAELPADSSVQDEIDRIAAEYDTDIARASAALRTVQDDVRYLFSALDFGGLVPATAEETWSRRFADCKGKTVLLLAMLHGLGFEAEPVLVDSISGDAVPNRLPMVGAFDHVIVRAVIDGQIYWLDGTDIGAESIDRIATPFFQWGLPVREHGAELVAIVPEPLTEPETRVSVNLDFSVGITAAGRIEGEIVLTGATADFVRQSTAYMSADEIDETLRAVWATYYPWAEIDSVQESDASAADEYGISMTGTVRSLWNARRYESIVGDLVFVQGAIERPPEQDQEAPYLVAYPQYIEVRETLTLPQDGQGFWLEGEDVDITAMGSHMVRTSRIESASVVIEGSLRSLQSEVSATELRADNRRIAALGGNRLYVYAPTDYRLSDEEQAAALGPNPASAKEFIDRGIVHLDNRRYELAIADFTSAIDLAPDESYGWANRGLAYVWLRDAANAQKDLEQAQTIDPNNAVVYRAFGLMALQQGNQSEAIDRFTQSLDLDPESSFAYRMRATARLQISDFDAAFEDSRSATLLDPSVAESYYVRSMVYGMRGRIDEAVAELKDMLETATVNAVVYRQAAQILARGGDREAAIEAVSKAFERQPTAGDLVMRAEFRDAAEVEAVQSDLEAAIEIEPGLREARLRLAMLHIDAGRPEEAITHLDATLARDSSDAEALGERGIAYALSGDDDLAALDFEAAHENARTASSLNSLCWRKATLDVALDHALSDCLSAIEMESRAMFHDSLGLVYYRLGRWDDAISAYDTAIELSDEEAHFLFGRALAKRGAGNQRGYRQDMQAALRAAPDIAETYAGYGIVP